MKIKKSLKKLIKKYREGYESKFQNGKPIDPNKYIDFEKFCKQALNEYRLGTVKAYLSHISKWNMPVNEETLSNFNNNVENIYDKKVESYNMEERSSKWSPKIEQRNNPDEMRRKRKRFKYFLYRAMIIYLKAIGKEEWLEKLPKKDHIKTVTPQIERDYLTEEEFEKYVGVINDSEMKALNYLLFYSGARISEALKIKKHNDWLPFYMKGKPIRVDKQEVFEITIPEQYVKAKEGQILLIDNNDEKAIDAIVDHIRSKNHREFIFSIHKKSRKRGSKTYIDVEREKNVLRNFMKEKLVECGLSHKARKMTIHGFRRSYIHMMDERTGHDYELVRSLARHTSGVEMTFRYLRNEKEDKKKKLREL